MTRPSQVRSDQWRVVVMQYHPNASGKANRVLPCTTGDAAGGGGADAAGHWG